MNKKAACIHTAGSRLDVRCHVCAFFNSEDEKYRVVLPVIKDSFECGDKAIQAVNLDQRNDHLRRLAEKGLTRSPPSRPGNLSFGSSCHSVRLVNLFDSSQRS